ncbi:c-type cytochrome [Chitinibacteraceae bacterium HSL-7]
MKGWVLISGMLLAAGAQASPQLLAKYSCTACHSVDAKIVGPAYKDVAKKYKGDKAAATKLEAKIKQGGSGVWGKVPMPANPAIPDADVKALAKWVLAQ